MPSKDKTKSKGTPRERSFKRTVLFLAVTLVLTVLSFSPSLDNGFTNWDDPGYVLENYSIRDLSQKNVANVFTSYLQGNYHPLTVLSYAVEYKFFQLDPKIYHITNLLLHVLNTTFVFWLIRLLTGRLETAAITAVLFGIHPLHVESVAWISERKDVLFSLFYLGSLISYVLSLTKVQDRVRYLIMSLVLFILSLLSKGVAVTLPLVLLLIDYYFKRTFTKKIFIEKIPFFLLSIGFGVIAILAQKSEGAIQTMTTYPFYDRLLIASYGIVTYLFKIFVPQQLSAFYPYP